MSKFNVGDKVIYTQIYDNIYHRYAAIVKSVATQWDLNKAGLPVNDDIITIQDERYGQIYYVGDDSLELYTDDIYVVYDNDYCVKGDDGYTYIEECLFGIFRNEKMAIGEMEKYANEGRYEKVGGIDPFIKEIYIIIIEESFRDEPEKKWGLRDKILIFTSINEAKKVCDELKDEKYQMRKTEIVDVED